MRVLILSCNTGGGHNSCANAIKEVFDIRGDSCTIEDALLFISENTSRFLSWGHVFLYRRLPWLFSWGYGRAEALEGAFREGHMLYNFFGKGADALSEKVRSGAYDAVISTHPFASLMLTEAKRRHGLCAKTAFVATDYTCSPSVQDSNLDLYFLPDASLAEEFACENIPPEKMVFSGIPIRQMFYHCTDRIQAKQRLGLPAHGKHIVMMCGSMGCGPIEKLTGLLAEHLGKDLDLTVVCGTNDRLKSALEQKYGRCEHLHLCGYVQDMSALLDSADLYLTKPGGLSVTEAAAKHLPMVLIDAVAGCETHNSAFYQSLGCAAAARNAEDIAALCLALLQNEDEYQRLIAAYTAYPLQNAAKCICDTLKSTAGAH